VNEGGGIGETNILVFTLVIVIIILGEGGGVPSDDGFVAVGAEVEGEHLTVEVFADGDFFVSFGVWDCKAVCYFQLNKGKEIKHNK
jgi:hypothetical protein